MVFELKCFHGIGAFGVELLKVPALKLFHPSAHSVSKVSWFFKNCGTVSDGEG